MLGEETVMRQGRTSREAINMLHTRVYARDYSAPIFGTFDEHLFFADDEQARAYISYTCFYVCTCASVT